MSYIPRLTQPDSGSPFYTMKSYGGYNSQIAGSPQPWSGSVLANCTGYVHGRWMEIGNTSTEYNLSNGNASTYWAHADQYERGQTPKLGALMVWSGGFAAYGYPGHVAIVEAIDSAGNVTASESNYGGPVFDTATYTKASNYVNWSALTFLGFIYHPNVDVEPLYNLTVINGTANKYSGKQGEKATVTATIPAGYKFWNWKISGAGTLSSLTISPATFTFGKGDATVSADFRKLPKKSSILLYTAPPVYRKQ